MMYATRREMDRLYRAGLSPREISVSMKISLRMVYKHLTLAMAGK